MDKVMIFPKRGGVAPPPLLPPYSAHYQEMYTCGDGCISLSQVACKLTGTFIFNDLKYVCVCMYLLVYVPEVAVNHTFENRFFLEKSFEISCSSCV